ncbi:hypothetical protein A2U01_0040093, partial [Trifolium medium]|nr:hypothetical protein [Trifolium medium]
PACDLSGGTKVMEHGLGLTGCTGVCTMLACLLKLRVDPWDLSECTGLVGLRQEGIA